MKIKLYARLIIEGAMDLDDVPMEYRLAVEMEIAEIMEGE